MSAPRIASPRVIVCGEDNLAYRLAYELADNGADVTVVYRPGHHDHERIGDIDGVTLVEAARIDRELLDRIDLASANTLALVDQNDGGNVDVALLAREIAPGVRIVMRLFDEVLAQSMGDLLPDCVALSATAVATPSFVAAALGPDETRPLRIAGRLLYVTERDNTAPADVVCVLASGADDPHVLPDAAGTDDVVLASRVSAEAAEEMPELAGPQSRADHAAHGERVTRRARRRTFFALTSLIGRRLWLLAAVLVGILIVGTIAFMLIRNLSFGEALYVAVLNTVGGAETDLNASAAQQVLQVILTIVSIALIPVATAAVVEAVVSARLAVAGGLAAPVRDHFVVIGLGDVGTRVLAALDDAGIPVVGIDIDSNARGVGLARQRHIPVLTADGKLEAALRAASLPQARGLLALTSSDTTNLEVALIGRKLSGELRAVLRIFDAEFAGRIQRAFGFAVSRSVSSLAAPSFAAAILGREVVATIAVRRRVLLVAEFAVGAGSGLEGRSVAQLRRDGQTQVLAIRTGRGGQVLWMPPAGRQLVRTDRVIAISTRAGLGTLLAMSASGGAPHPLAVVDVTRPELT